MNACSPACGYCGRCETREGGRVIDVPCDRCGRLVEIGSAEEDAPTVWCERCRLEVAAINDAVFQRAITGWFRKTGTE